MVLESDVSQTSSGIFVSFYTLLHLGADVYMLFFK